MRRLSGVLGLFALGAMMLTVALLHNDPARAATGPCGTTHDAVDSEEQQLIGLLEQWRAQHVSGAPGLNVSGALSAAAAWYAQHQVEAGPFGGHADQFGRTYWERARDCGYPSNYAMGSGEGVYVFGSSGNPHIGPAEAMAGLDYPGSGINMPAGSGSLPAKCVGVGVYRGGGTTAWIVIIAQYPAAQACPASSAQPPTPPTTAPTTPAGATNTATSTSTSTSTATATATATKTATPTGTATPTAPAGYVLRVPGMACDDCSGSGETATPTPSPSPTPTQTATPTQSSTVTVTATATSSATAVPTSGPPPSGCGDSNGWRICVDSGPFGADAGRFFVTVTSLVARTGTPIVEARVTQPGDGSACGTAERPFDGATITFDYRGDFPTCGPPQAGDYVVAISVDSGVVATVTYELGAP